MTLTLRKIQSAMKCAKVRKAFHAFHGLTHCVYFGSVFLKYHNFYVLTAGILFLLTALAVLTGGDE